MIYFVATIEDLEKMNTRTVGYFKTLEAILNNRYDIHEDIGKPKELENYAGFTIG